MATASKNGLRDLAESGFSGYRIDPRKIEVEKGFNARNFDLPENQEHVQNLATSIAAVGVQNPLVVRFEKGRIILVDGESRLRATMRAIKDGAEIKTIPVIQEEKHVSDEDRVASLLSRNTGKPLSFIERGNVFARLKNFGWSDQDIARKTGITQAHVSNIMTLHAAPAGVKKMVESGKVSSSLAVQMIRDHGEDAAQILREVAAEDGKSHITAKDVEHIEPTIEKKARGKKGEKIDFFGRGNAKQYLLGICDIYFNARELSSPQVQGICRNIMEDVLGADWKTIAKQFFEEESK